MKGNAIHFCISPLQQSFSEYPGGSITFECPCRNSRVPRVLSRAGIGRLGESTGESNIPRVCPQREHLVGGLTASLRNFNRIVALFNTWGVLSIRPGRF